MCDDDPTFGHDGEFAGWADRLASHLSEIARAEGLDFGYANLAVRGRKLADVVGPQLEDALALQPDLVSIVGGGNDILRPKADLDGLAARLEAAVARVRATGADVLMATPGRPGGCPARQGHPRPGRHPHGQHLEHRPPQRRPRHRPVGPARPARLAHVVRGPHPHDDRGPPPRLARRARGAGPHAGRDRLGHPARPGPADRPPRGPAGQRAVGQGVRRARGSTAASPAAPPATTARPSAPTSAPSTPPDPAHRARYAVPLAQPDGIPPRWAGRVTHLRRLDPAAEHDVRGRPPRRCRHPSRAQACGEVRHALRPLRQPPRMTSASIRPRPRRRPRRGRTPADVVTAVQRLGGTCTWRELRRAVPWRLIGPAVDAGLVRHPGHGHYALPSADLARVAARRMTGVVSHRTAAAALGLEGQDAPRPPRRHDPRQTASSATAPAGSRRPTAARSPRPTCRTAGSPLRSGPSSTAASTCPSTRPCRSSTRPSAPDCRGARSSSAAGALGPRHRATVLAVERHAQRQGRQPLRVGASRHRPVRSTGRTLGPAAPDPLRRLLRSGRPRRRRPRHRARGRQLRVPRRAGRHVARLRALRRARRPRLARAALHLGAGDAPAGVGRRRHRAHGAPPPRRAARQPPTWDG